MRICRRLSSFCVLASLVLLWGASPRGFAAGADGKSTTQVAPSTPPAVSEPSNSPLPPVIDFDESDQNASVSDATHSSDNSEQIRSISFIRLNREKVDQMIQQIQSTYSARGSDAVMSLFRGFTQNPESREILQHMSQSGLKFKMKRTIHRSEKDALRWMNKMFKGMGLPNLRFSRKISNDAPDFTDLPEKQVKTTKWVRYAFGPFVAFLSGAAQMYATYKTGSAAHIPLKDMLVMMVPAAGVGVEVIILEWQFAWPWLNKVFWAKVWDFGGAVGGRISNIVVNTLYDFFGAATVAGLTYWASHHLSSEHAVKSLNVQTFVIGSALLWGFLRGLWFHAVMGQFQTDKKIDMTRGATNGLFRYSEETKGLAVNQSARVGSWFYHGPWPKVAQVGFFIFKTYPALVKTNVEPSVRAAELHRAISPSTAPKKSFWEGCKRLMIKAAVTPRIQFRPRFSMGVSHLPQLQRDPITP